MAKSPLIQYNQNVPGGPGLIGPAAGQPGYGNSANYYK